MTVQEYLDKTRNFMNDVNLRPGVVCADGFQISIQASPFHYCYPKDNNAENFEKVELGFPNQKDDLIMEYAKNPDYPTLTVYGYVPIEVVDKLMEKHGGIVGRFDDKEALRYEFR